MSSLSIRFKVYMDGKEYVVQKGSVEWCFLRTYMKRKRYISTMTVLWNRYWVSVPHVPFYMDVSLPKKFVLLLGPMFRSPVSNIGHELSIYLQALDWIGHLKGMIRTLIPNERKCFWKTQHLHLLLPPPMCLPTPLRDKWFINNDQHTCLSSFSLELLHTRHIQQWEWVRAWFKEQFPHHSIYYTQKNLPRLQPVIPSVSVIIHDICPVQDIPRLVRMSRKHLVWKANTLPIIEHIYLYAHHPPSFLSPPNLPIHMINIQNMPPYEIYKMMQSSRHIYRSHLLPCTEFIVIGLSVTDALIYLPGSFTELDSLFQK